MNRREFLKILAVSGTFPVSVLAAQKYQVPVLMYHDINNDANDEYSVSPTLFRNHIQWLVNNGYQAIPIKDLDRAGPKDIVITFDDGYYSFINHAQQILSDHKFYATINVVGKWMSSTNEYIYDIKPRRALHWGQLKQLRDTGLVEIGCHTDNLHNFKKGVLQCNRQELELDFKTFQFNMLVHTGKEANIIAWPYGRFNELAVKVAKESRFEYILTSRRGSYNGDKLHIPRLSLTKENTLQRLLSDG